MLIVIGRAQALPGRRDELVAAVRDVAAGTRGDDGCQSYGFYADLDDDATILGVEIWRDRAALDAHLTHEHTHQFVTRVSGLVDGEPSMSFHQVNS